LTPLSRRGAGSGYGREMFTRRRVLLVATALLVLIAALLTPLVIIRLDASGHISPDPADVSHHQVAIVLGAGLTEDGKASGSWPIGWTPRSASTSWARSTVC
jgi:hypothetical protein